MRPNTVQKNKRIKLRPGQKDPAILYPIFQLLFGIYVMLSFLEMNGIRIHCTDAELVDVGLSVADGGMDYEGLLEWVRNHKE